MDIDVRGARLVDAHFVVESNCQLASETEGLTLERGIVEAGVGAILGDASKGRYFIAMVEGRAVGQLMVTYEWSDWRNGMIWWIQSVYVAAEFRRRGVFTALYQYIRALAGKSGAVGLRLYVEENNSAAQGTYKHMGMDMSHYRVMEEIF